MPKLKNKKCLYCDNITDDSPHFESDCCGRGMCDNCFDNLQGTDEQIQLDYADDETFFSIKRKYRNSAYLCFECVHIWQKNFKINKIILWLKNIITILINLLTGQQKN